MEPAPLPSDPTPDPSRPPLALVRDPLAGDVPTPIDPDSPDDRVLHGSSSYVRLQTLVDPRAPRLLRAAFATMWVMVGFLALHQLVGLGERWDTLVNVWFNNLVFLGASLATAWRAISIRAERRAWWFVSAALLMYFVGDQVYTSLYADTDAWVTWADAFYLAFVPIMFIGIVGLVRTRIGRFELDRWIDGLAAALLVALPGVVFILEPTIRAAIADGGTALEIAVTVAYPITDIVLLGSVVGVCALAGWQPGRAWLTFGLGLACFVAADSFYAVSNLRGEYGLGAFYEWLWPLAGLLIATAAWLRPLRHLEVHAWGLRSIALPVVCQVAPIAFMVMKDEPASEQLIMTAVLMIVLVQLVVTRPRKPAHLT